MSLAELEFRRAVERGLPICMFIMHAKHPVDRSAVHSEDDVAAAKLAAFAALAKKDRIYAEFKSVEDLKVKVVQTLRLLRGLLDKAPPPKPPAASPPADDIPAPPAFYAKPSYIPGFAFQGRVKELAALRDWAGSADNLMLVDAIGGMGKSMAAWEWVTKHAARERPDWAGRLWYSFYERGATMHDFCVTALAYMTRCPRELFANEPTRPSRRPADGGSARQTLVASPGWIGTRARRYHRSDAAQIPDAEVEPGTDDSCIRPDDEDLLRQLCAAAPSKILATSRLTPRAWLNPAAQPLPGVRRWQLVGRTRATPRR